MQCFVCGQEGNNVITFTDATFQKCSNMITFRKRKKFKYGDLELNSKSKSDSGYHVACYQKVAVLKQKFKQEFEAMFLPVYTEEESAASEEHQIVENVQQVMNPNSVSHENHECKSTTPSGINGIPLMNLSSTSTPSATSVMHDANDIPKDLEDAGLVQSFTSSEHASQNASDSSATSKEIPNSVNVSTGGETSQIVCIFCSNHRRRVGARQVQAIMCPSEETRQRILEFAEILHDESLISIVRNSETIHYHKSCYSGYQSKKVREATKTSSPTRWRNIRHLHSATFEALSEIIQDEIIEQEKIYYLVDLHAKYKSLFVELGNGEFVREHVDSYKIDVLQSKILDRFVGEVTIEASEGIHKKRVVFKIDIDLSRLVNERLLNETERATTVEQVAFEIRNAVITMETRKLPQKLQVEDVIAGECDVPEILFAFMCNLIQGPNWRRKHSDHDYVRIKSLCSDIIFLISKGRVKPSKQIMLGLAIKSLTSSRKVLTLLNKYGHTVGYHVAEEIETELTFSAHEDQKTIPTGILPIPGLSTHVAFDNFDLFVDTVNGKDTMHDTVGIIYQFATKDSRPEEPLLIEAEKELALQVNVDSPDISDYKIPRKRRRFEEVPHEVQPYYRKPSAAISILPYDEILSALELCRASRERAILKDIFWVICFARLENTPMWVGFNCSTTVDSSKMQNIQYLPQINSSPTSYPVVRTTLVKASAIAKECRQPEIICTYDLAIAKMAMQIQASETPEFDNIFINLGGFHLQMAFFKAIGKYIDASGITDILSETEVLAAGSVNSFLDCKHFNRCKRIHPLLSAALQILHFESFLEDLDFEEDDVIPDLQTAATKQIEHDTDLDISPSVNFALAKYQAYCASTLAGDHGKTAKFHLQYVQLINVFFRFSRSIRTSDFELYVDSIFEIANLFFAMNQPNYARWSLKYVSNLLNLKLSDSDLLRQFREGAFGIRRTKGTLARAPVDLTLEQTINADAANSLTGISHFTNSASARQRWALSHSMRVTVLTKVLDEVGITRKDDVSYELQTSRLKKDRKAVELLVECIKENVNPFDPKIDSSELYHLVTGRAASSNVSEFLLNVNELGNDQKVRFLKECEQDPKRFDRPIKRNAILNFASDCMKKVQKSQDGSKQALIKMERDVFGRLLAIALEKKVDMELCLSYPLAPAPPALCDYSGNMHSTDKSALGKVLKARITSTPPDSVDVDVIDGFYFMHLCGSSLPLTFEKIAETILFRICDTSASEIHLVFDRYFSPSIKDCERQNRDGLDISYTIVGPKQTRPNDFIKSLKNRKFKEALVMFLSDSWENDSMVHVLKNKKVFLTVEERCFSYEVLDNRVVKTEETDFQCFHEEADTRMILHIAKSRPESKIMVKASDTDVLILLLYHMRNFGDLKVWMAGSSAKKNEQECTDCTKLANNLGSLLCGALLAFHAYTGCDYTAAFYRKGKVRPFKIMEKNVSYQKIFASLLDLSDIDDREKMNALQEFTSLMYGVRKCDNVDTARFIIFQKQYSSKKQTENLIKKVKGFDSSLIPPCFKSLREKIRRTIYVTSMWKNATAPKCVSISPEVCGWVMRTTLKPLWFYGDPTPLMVDDIVVATNSNRSDNSEDEDDLNDEAYTSDSDAE